MPRNGSSVYSLPAGNPVIPGTVIATTWANTTLTDIATALTNSLSTDGSTASVSLAGKTMSGGTFSAPTVTGIQDLQGGQIKFPAVQVPSANANTLDDYEEGTFTPSITFSTPGNLSVGYATRAGIYTKIGGHVFISYQINTAGFTHTTASGNLRVTGFPFNPPATPLVAGSLVYSGLDLTAGYQQVTTVTVASSALNEFWQQGDGAGAAIITTAQAPTGTDKVLMGSTNYFSG
jgi:hypothetical protein